LPKGWLNGKYKKHKECDWIRLRDMPEKQEKFLEELSQLTPPDVGWSIDANCCI